MRTFEVRTPDGLRIAALEAGNPNGPGIVFLHGISQSALCWRRQLADETLAAEFRMIAYDLRGHGGSDKPTDPASYADDRVWADELAAVIAAAKLARPVLVVWSYAGRIVSDYAQSYGTDGIAGVNFVAACSLESDEFFGPDDAHLKGMCSEDLATNIAATRAFVRILTAAPMEPADLETTLAYNMVVRARVRAAVLARSRNPGDMLPRLALPVLVTHGDRDRLVLPELGRYTAQAVPGAQLSLYEAIGHTPFWEDAPRFNRELAELVQAANR